MKERLVFILAAGALFLLLGAVAFRTYATAQGVPLLGVDACVFLPQTVPFHERGELINAVWKGARKLDSLGQGRMVYHGFLFPMILSLLMWRSDYLGLCAALALVHALATLLPGLMLWHLAKSWNWKLTNGRFLLLLLLTAAGANYTQGALGRPEPLAAIFLVGAVLGIARAPLSCHAKIAGVAIGLVAATDPILAVFAGFMIAAYSAWRFSLGRCLLEIALGAGISVTVFAGCFLFYPYSFHDWFLGTWRMGNYALEHGNGPRFWLGFLSDYLVRGASWFLLGSLVLVWSGVRMLRRSLRSGDRPKAPIIFIGALILATVATFRFVLYTPWACYTLLPLMPVGFVAIFYELGHGFDSARDRSLRFRVAAVAILLIASLGLLGDVGERAQILHAGFALPAAREKFAALRARHPQARIALHRFLFTLTEDPTHITYVFSQVPPADADLFVLPQAYLGFPEPPEINGFRVEEIFFNPRRARFFGFPFWTRDRGCGFAVYGRR